GQRVTLGGITLTAHITPGHTPGCTTWTTRLQKLDIAFLCSPTVPDVYKLVGNPKYPGIIDDYRVQFAFLRSIHPDIFLGSHGSFFDLARKSAALRKHPKRNPFIEPEGYTKFVDEMEKKFKEMVAKQTAAAQ
ncbi:MAG TPA: subclass B3 metallo-beta-lactamase, partial [Thermoanaerobaculia bacterium]